MSEQRPGDPGRPDDGPGPAPSGIWSTLTFTAAGGLVAATVGPEGRIHRITVDTRMQQYGLEVICQQIVEAVNQGLTAVQGRAAPAVSTGVRQSDPLLLAARLDEVRGESARRAAAINEAIGDIAAQLRQSRG